MPLAADAAAPLSRARLPRPRWSRSGGPAAARKSAGRVMIATVIAITTVAAEGAQPVAAAAGETTERRRRASGTGAGGASVTASSASRVPMRRHPMRRTAVAAAPTDGAPAREPREEQGSSAARALCRQGRDSDKGRDKGKFGGRDKGGRDKGGRDRDKRPRGRAVAPALCHQRAAARARSPDRSQFAVRQAGGAEGTTHRRPQGLTSVDADAGEPAA